MFKKGSKEEIKYLQDQILEHSDYSIAEVLSMEYERLVHVYNAVMGIYEEV